jgi:hypothetical protein
MSQLCGGIAVVKKFSIRPFLCACVLLVCPFGGEALGATAGKTRTFNAHADTLIAGCELILFGKEVPIAEHAGRRGYWISKGDSSVVVNGIVCMSQSTFFLPRAKSHPDAEAAVRRMCKAADMIWSSMESKNGRVLLEGKEHSPNETFQMSLPGETNEVTVRLASDDMVITDGKYHVSFPLERPQPKAGINRAEQRLDGAYWAVVKALRPGRLVVMGREYEFHYPLERSAEVRSALAEVPSLATVDYQDSDGVVHYKAINVGLGVWTSALISDFVGR